MLRPRTDSSAISSGRLRIMLWMLPILFGLAVLPAILPSGFVSIVIVLLTYVSMATAWNLLGGYLGDLSFGHAVFYGIGAYTYGLLVHYGVSSFPPLNMMAGGVIAMIFGVLLGVPFLRLKGLYFAIGTLGMSQVVRIIFENSDFTLKSHGVLIPIEQSYSIIPYYYYAFVITLAILLLNYAIINSRLGIAFLSIRDNPSAAEMLGINVTGYRVLCFSISGFFVGVVGAFFAFFNHYIFPSGVFSVDLSFEILLMALFGGVGTFSGPIIGAITVFFVEELGRSFIRVGFLLLLSVMLMVVFLLMPGGVVGTLRRQAPFVNPLDLLKRLGGSARG